MWRRGDFVWKRAGSRRFQSAVRRNVVEDEGDWKYASEWWGAEGSDGGHTVFRSTSDHGNGVVSVVSYPCSKPAPEQLPAVEKWLQQRYTKLHPEFEHNEQFKVLGYQWRVLHFNDNTRQSATKVMAAYRKSDPASLYLMQQPNCLPVPYLKSMVSAGLTSLASSGYDIFEAVAGKRTLNVLCIGHGGGNLPLFLASKIKGANVHSVEIDPVVIAASTQVMGFPSSTVMEKTLVQISSPQPTDSEQLLWQDVHQRISLYRADAEDFILNSSNTYDLMFVDAYDGDDIFPHKLWDPKGLFLKSLKERLHPVHGTVAVNLHSDSDVLASGMAVNCSSEFILPMGKYISQVCRSYKDNIGLAYKVSVPWLCNITLVASTGVGLRNGSGGVTVSRDLILSSLVSKSNLVELLLDLPFPCLEYIKRGFVLVD
ncbi:uncharacterized protein A4U43_C04F1940 [Asparagus officinalis]|uniref:Methyltransferase domain-containing protein n=1 Tax=Asparagus officinalis TaxID=4686 RepID=A0A5P1F093_ASPOF|nr:uncharacterized protein LOC109836422 [Asparagus officinalis]ONK70827.1 uncharacterized protein A4U43_C04F1940 [Asparagus officinalis]